MIKELDESKFATKVIEDLGMRSSGKRMVRTVILGCVVCGEGFTISADNAIRRQESVCHKCKVVNTYEGTVHAKITNVLEMVAVGKSMVQELEFKCNTCETLFIETVRKAKSNTDGECTVCQENRKDITRHVVYDGSRLLLRDSGAELPVHKDGRVSYYGKKYNAAKLVLLITTGKYPEYKVIPINGNRQDIRVGNIARFEHGKGVTRGTKFTPEYLANEVKKYVSRAELKRHNQSAYAYIMRNGLDTSGLFDRYGAPKLCDGDVVYVWEAEELPGVYKIGVTSARLGTDRISFVSRLANVTPIIHTVCKVSNAYSIEKVLLQFGSAYEFDTIFNGSTEFRVLSNIQLQKTLEIISKESTHE